MKKLMAIIMISLLTVGMLSACGQKNGKSADDKKVLVMATSADYPPFEYVDTAKSDKIVGFDIDLANALAKKLGYKIKVEDKDFSGLITALKTKQADLVLSGMTPTEKRKKNVDFSDVYYEANDMLITKKDSNIKSVEDLKGGKVGAQLGSIQEDAAKDLQKKVNVQVETRNRIPELVQDVVNGRFQGAIIEDTVAKGYLKKDKQLTGMTLGSKDDEKGSAIAFPKGSPIKDKFNKALKEMKDNGELDKLVVKWFGGEQK
ncbi:transporter substrate-binding domain-containing protein [Falsibacillus albus]|uniref:ABC transporter substrate-binding protein n=1 Tax=Falsibacillus albus TaxID=2478915 RepID=A0A3L7JM12_9BACI|nr:transporter substrate-binding domain-containing protein [Falsibacillus albus]RLQ91119.1 ABC transporter substrate-binding protein [Falsibacillus albus]